MEDDANSIPKLPIPGKRNILITSALPDVYNVPQLGNITGCVLRADVYARYCRLRGYNALYICGTDEYGTSTVFSEENCTAKEICDKYHAVHKDVYDWFDITFDKFGRTSTPEHTQVCQAVYSKLWELSEETTKQLSCYYCKQFFSADFLDPYGGCNHDPVRRDQCKTFRKLLNPPDLKYLCCKLERYIDETSAAGAWGQNAIQSTKAWLEKGIGKIVITRDLKWGVPLPSEKYEDKVFYVWHNAPIGYVSITSCYTSEWEKWWKNPENVELYQFMGKDTVPHHTVMFPSMQLGTGENWTLVKTISVTEYLNYKGGKLSKNKGAGVFGNAVKDTSIPVEVWRYYLLTDMPEVSDASFVSKDLQAKLNNKSLSNLGNFVKRVLSFIAKPESAGYGSVVPDAPGAESHLPTVSLGRKVGKLVEEYVEAMEKVKLKQGLKTAMSISVEGNRYLQEFQLRKLDRTDKPYCAIVIRTAAGLIHLLAQLLEPFMPSFSREVFKQMNLPPHFSLSDERGEVLQASRPWKILPPSHMIGTPQLLFKELKGEEMQQYVEKCLADRCASDAAASRRRARRHAARIRRYAEEPANLITRLRLRSREASSSKSDRATLEAGWDKGMHETCTNSSHDGALADLVDQLRRERLESRAARSSETKGGAIQMLTCAEAQANWVQKRLGSREASGLGAD
ncbi:methionine--tRNA ligase, cytoplasmic isoform X2 [Capsella rubella]|uniref:methionine--tRNA ligase, cytoplasmic isoform X2 n=1 Tax=Capsella rubella TaxID=81985 RepID=UPI000CD5671A|nr:methionine--tRNA ligase, cytoplasmic isoform X2 [Capsella rubella]